MRKISKNSMQKVLLLFHIIPVLNLVQILGGLDCISINLTPQVPVALSSSQVSPSKSLLSSIVSTKSWYQFFGDGFAIRVPPEFQDIMEPEDLNTGESLYGDKVKEQPFGALFASSDGSSAHNVHAGGATLYSARSIKIKEDDGFRTYYLYEFGRDEQHFALVAGVSSGKAIVAAALHHSPSGKQMV
ncbi:Mog1/PsbP, alpha/beta/alpha sandwich [Sesbania bispinosa]|nr:Mog1/PsbP, alpha/beta/alpha sandwich [Sesbania bispinosa]